MPSEPITPRNAFQDPRQVARYADGPPRFVPGFADMHRMVTLLLAERVPTDGRVLVVGAGGGLELRTFAQAHPGWTFEGVDPSAEMLQLAEQTLGPLASRVRLRKGAVDVVRDGPSTRRPVSSRCTSWPAMNVGGRWRKSATDSSPGRRLCRSTRASPPKEAGGQPG